MPLKYFELDRFILKNLLREKNISHGQAARRLKISTKSIQRWINGTTRRIRSDRLNQLSEYLSVESSRLVLGDIENDLRIKRSNELILHFTSHESQMRVWADEDWKKYIKALKEIAVRDLSTYQEMIVLKRIGFCFLGMGSLKTAVHYLKKAKLKAKKLNHADELIRTKSLLALCDGLNGNFKKAYEQISEAEKYLAQATSLGRSVLYYCKGRVLLSNGCYLAAEKDLRKAASLALQTAEKNYLWPATAYLYLAWTYLRMKNYPEAHRSFGRSLDLATTSGWPYGIAVATLGMEVVKSLLHLSHEKNHNILKKVKRYFKLVQVPAIDTRFRQLLLAYSILIENFEEARKALSERKTPYRRSKLFYSYYILDSLLLSKVMDDSESVSGKDVKRASDFFRKHRMQSELDCLKWLSTKRKVDKIQFFQLFSFF